MAEILHQNVEINATAHASTNKTFYHFKGSPARESAAHVLSGMISGFACKVVEYPFDTVKVMLQSESSNLYKGPLDVIVKTSRSKGFSSLYQGLTSPLVGAMLENSVLFASYGIVKKQLNVNDNPTLHSPNPMWKYLLSGAGSGICSAFILTPVELIKCRIQVQQIGNVSVLKYAGPIDCVIQTVKSEGITGLWKGNVSCLIREIPGNMAWFGTYEFIRGHVQRYFKYETMNDVPLAWKAFAGACAGVAYWAVPFPADTVKSRIQTIPRYADMSFLKALNTIVREEGVSALYNGIGITCLRAAPSHALIFYFYELSFEMLGQL